MNLQKRIDKAEAEWIARAQAEREAAKDAVWEWVQANSPPEEYNAYCRVYFAPCFEIVRAVSRAGENLSEAERMALALDENLGELRAEDHAIAEALDARIPPELILRLNRALAVTLPGDGPP